MLLRDDAIVLAYRGELTGCTGAADESRIEGVQVLFHARRIVALGIDGDIDDLDVVCSRAELAPRLRQSCERDRAHVRAPREAEAQDHDFAAIAAQLELAAARALQRE